MNEVVLELKKRQILNSLIDKIIRENIEYEKRARMKRGLVHNLVSEKLDLILNNDLAKLVNERMVEMGFRKVKSSNTLYFKYAKFK